MFGEDRKKKTLDEFFRTLLSRKQRPGIEAACLDMWEPYRLRLEQWVPGCRVVYDKFHILQHANAAIDEVRRAEFFRQGGRQRELAKGKRWLLLSRWVNLNTEKKRQLNQLFGVNRRMLKAYLLKESLSRLWEYRYEGAMLRYLQSWIDQLRWQRLKPFEKLAWMLLDRLEGILETPFPLPVDPQPLMFRIEAVTYPWLFPFWVTSLIKACMNPMIRTLPPPEPARVQVMAVVERDRRHGTARREPGHATQTRIGVVGPARDTQERGAGQDVLPVSTTPFVNQTLPPAVSAPASCPFRN
jgi:Transposase